MQRVSVAVYRPVWEGAIEDHARKQARRHEWRVAPQWGYDDLIQEAFLLFCKLSDRYVRVNNAKHFMRLFSTAFSRMITDLSRTRTKHREISVSLVHEEALPSKRDDFGTLIRRMDEEGRGKPAKILRALRAVEFGDIPTLRISSGVRRPTEALIRGAIGDFGGKPLVPLLREYFYGD